MTLDVQSSVARILGFVVGVLTLAAAIVIGGVVLAAFIGLAVLGGIALAARLWWLRRKMRQAMARGEPPGAGDRVIETEYHVIEITEERDDTDGR